MRLSFLFVGSDKGDYVKAGLDLYLKRLQRFAKVEVKHTPNLKGIKLPEEQRLQEAQQLLKITNPTDFLVLLDEKGKQFSSAEMASFIEQKKNQGNTSLVFLICGAFGAHDLLKERANFCLGLSKLTFSHQLARVILMEQVYRSFTIINNHPYHNEG